MKYNQVQCKRNENYNISNLKKGIGDPNIKPIKESSEVQRIQIADGDIFRNVVIPIYMVFPRW